MRTEDRVQQRNQAYDPVNICKGRRSTLYVHKALFVCRNCKTVSPITAALCVNVLFNKQQSAHVEEIVIIKKKVPHYLRLSNQLIDFNSKITT